MNSIFIIMLSVFILCASRAPFPDLTDTNFQNECVLAHNNYRTKHNTPSLIPNNTIVAYAKTRCNTTSQFSGLSNGHTGLVGFGENIFWGSSSAPYVFNCNTAVKSWYDEISKYNYSNPGFSSATGHFTQVVWKSSKYVGCARCGGQDINGTKWYETYIICDYSPPGNYLGQFQQNVLPPK